MDKIKCLVTGGAGFIGSYITDFLINKGYEVVIIDNLSTGKKENVNKNSKFYEVDITNDINWIFQQEKPDIVIHTAAQVMVRTSIENPLFDAKINILGTINVLEGCRKNKVKKIIYTSTGGARVGEPEYLPVDEKHFLNPSSPYGISKHTAEHYIQIYNKLYDLDYLIYCFGNVYGPRDDPKCNRVTSIFAYQMLKGQIPVIFGDGNQTRDFIYVLDLAEFIVNNLEKKPKHKLFHLANGEKISVNEIFQILKKLIGFKGEPNYVNEIKGEVRNIVLDTTLVQKELGWKPTYSFEDGLNEVVEWFKKQDLKI